MSWHTKLTWQSAQARAKLLHSIRRFFEQKEVIEVDTPLMSSGTITDVHLDAFATRYKFVANDQSSAKLYMQTSPEFAMKRLLSSGYGSIYQICKAFRDEPSGRLHNPEFTILEWYRLGFDHHELMNEISELLTKVLGCLPAEKQSYQDAFLQYTGLDPLTVDISELKAYLTNSKRLDDWLSEEQDIDILLQFVFAEDVESKIGQETPIFIYNFPASQAALAKLSTEDSRVAERFECYFKGVELANGFHELTDAEQQLTRFKQDNEKRRAKGLSEKPIDAKFIEALTHGLPQCAGVALGIDRLVMLALEVNHINQAVSFTISDA